MTTASSASIAGWIAALKARNPLPPEAIEEAVAYLLDPSGDPGLKADFLQFLNEKGETDAEIGGFAEAFLARSVNPGLDPARMPGPLLDCCGTGGDKLEMFNVSTAAMFVMAAGGVCVVKHGNRSITSKCGGADVLEALGIRIDLPPADFKGCVEKVGCGFMFAPHYHPAFKAIAPVRKALGEKGVPTIFNLLGPILNPARPDYQLVGVFTPAALPKFCAVLRRLGRKHAWAVHGSIGDGLGMDEMSTQGLTEVCSVTDGEIHSFSVDPEVLGFRKAGLAELKGGDAGINAGILRDILSGKPGPKRDLVLLNAAAGFVITRITPDLETGLALGMEVIDSGRAMEKLKALRDFRAK
jgi:anthranilate phosphoribosyltransferase